MVRLFRQHEKRKVYGLNGLWRFCTDPEGTGIAAGYAAGLPQTAYRVEVPSNWDNQYGLYGYTGIVWYSTVFKTEKPNVLIRFHGVGGSAKVFVDGEPAGCHKGGYTPFDVIRENILPGCHVLCVMADNRHDDATIPLDKTGWINYGGISRAVEIMELEGRYIENCRIEYTLESDYKSAVLDIYADIYSFKEYNGESILKLTIENARGIEKELTAEVDGKSRGKETVRFSGLKLQDILLWDTGAPNLYTFRFQLEEDDFAERTGFREIKVFEGQILLNGKKIKCAGINRHEEHPDWGHAVPFKLMQRDMAIIRELGFNAIRGSHYPMAPVWLDLCDEEGMLFIEEIPLWQFWEKQLKQPEVTEGALAMLREMIGRDYHHPCIVMWSLHNECDTRCAAGYELTRRMAEQAQSLDGTRPLTFATHFPMEDICLGLVDVICINGYLGWYQGKISDWAGFLENMRRRLHELGLEKSPVVISEFGADAVPGASTLDGLKWTEDFQESYLRYCIELFENTPMVSGFFIWQFCDTRANVNEIMGRPRGFNNKGIVDEYRRPKAAYREIKELLSRRNMQQGTD